MTGFLVIECSHTEILLENMDIKSYQLFEEYTQLKVSSSVQYIANLMCNVKISSFKVCSEFHS